MSPEQIAENLEVFRLLLTNAPIFRIDANPSAQDRPSAQHQQLITDLVNQLLREDITPNAFEQLRQSLLDSYQQHLTADWQTLLTFNLMEDDYLIKATTEATPQPQPGILQSRVCNDQGTSCEHVNSLAHSRDYIHRVVDGENISTIKPLPILDDIRKRRGIYQAPRTLIIEGVEPESPEPSPTHQEEVDMDEILQNAEPVNWGYVPTTDVDREIVEILDDMIYDEEPSPPAADTASVAASPASNEGLSALAVALRDHALVAKHMLGAVLAPTPQAAAQLLAQSSGLLESSEGVSTVPTSPEVDASPAAEGAEPTPASSMPLTTDAGLSEPGEQPAPSAPDAPVAPAEPGPSPLLHSARSQSIPPAPEPSPQATDYSHLKMGALMLTEEQKRTYDTTYGAGGDAFAKTLAGVIHQARSNHRWDHAKNLADRAAYHANVGLATPQIGEYLSEMRKPLSFALAGAKQALIDGQALDHNSSEYKTLERNYNQAKCVNDALKVVSHYQAGGKKVSAREIADLLKDIGPGGPYADKALYEEVGKQMEPVISQKRADRMAMAQAQGNTDTFRGRRDMKKTAEQEAKFFQRNHFSFKEQDGHVSGRIKFDNKSLLGLNKGLNSISGARSALAELNKAVSGFVDMTIVKSGLGTSPEKPIDLKVNPPPSYELACSFIMDIKQRAINTGEPFHIKVPEALKGQAPFGDMETFTIGGDTQLSAHEKAYFEHFANQTSKIRQGGQDIDAPRTAIQSLSRARPAGTKEIKYGESPSDFWQQQIKRETLKNKKLFSRNMEKAADLVVKVDKKMDKSSRMTR